MGDDGSKLSALPKETPKIASTSANTFASTSASGANDRIYLIEANPNPWLDPIAEFAMAAKESGRSYTQMIDAIVKGAAEVGQPFDR